MFEDNVFPYARVGSSIARGAQREAAEDAWWNQFLPGHVGEAATVQVPAPPPESLTLVYQPSFAGPLGGGEIVWTWVPSDRDDEGSYEPVLILGRALGERFHAVRLSAKARSGDRRLLPIGAGPRYAGRRFSWADIDRIFAVHPTGLRRREFAIDEAHFTRIIDVLHWRYGWEVGK